MVALDEELSGIADRPERYLGSTAGSRGTDSGAPGSMSRNHPRSVPYCSDSHLPDSDFSRHYARNRNYSPSIGRFISQDPLQFINGANTYQFVTSSPVGNVDPLGNAVSATGQVSPSTAKGGAPGSGSVSATGTATRTVTVKTGGGSSVSVTASGGGSGKITKNPAFPASQGQVKGQLNLPIVPGSLFSMFCVYNPQIGKYSGGFQHSVGKNTTVGLNIQPFPGGTSAVVTVTIK